MDENEGFNFNNRESNEKVKRDPSVPSIVQLQDHDLDRDPGSSRNLEQDLEVWEDDSKENFIKSKCFSKGFDLWIVPEVSCSNISSYLNWLLNFKISQSLPPKSQRYSEHTQRHSEQLSEFSQVPESPLLIPSHPVFPNRWVLRIYFDNQLESWCRVIKFNVKNLSVPQKNPVKVRIFLPQGIDAESFKRIYDSISI